MKKVLLELRPAFEGYAGIPQETRLLFRGLASMSDIELEGLLQISNRRLARGLPQVERAFWRRVPSRRFNRFSRVVISLADTPYQNLFDATIDFLARRAERAVLSIGTLAGVKVVTLSRFESDCFEDFVWRTLFSKTLPAADYPTVVTKNFRVCSTPWNSLHWAGLRTLNLFTTPLYPVLDARTFDIFIAQTPYPARLRPQTKLVVRYHDAVPVFMPHTIDDRSRHQAKHFFALTSNVKNGGYFACVSEATRQDLLRLFPQVASRAVTIHNMVSHHYFREDSDRRLVPGILRARLYDGEDPRNRELKIHFLGAREKENFYKKALGSGEFPYLLIVSTIEPRKNHSRLLAAWEVLKAEVDPTLKLVIVGSLGWDFDTLVPNLKAWMGRGELFMVEKVPSPDLRVLYRHAAATVCPSVGEGFDYSGVEAMLSGGVVAASDIPVHREVYEDAAEYFDPYSTGSLVRTLRRLVYETDSPILGARLQERGAEIGQRYAPAKILPRWRAFLRGVSQGQVFENGTIEVLPTDLDVLSSTQ